VSLEPAVRQELLSIAREAILRRLGGEGTLRAPAGEELMRPRGAFVTLRGRDGALRGCVGYPEPRFPLAEAVARAAAAAATKDHRFPRVRPEELPGLAIEISVLGPLEAIAPQAVEIGVHGLVVRFQGRSGLLLPQVPVEHGWGRETFLDETCRKAGLPRGSWREEGAQILGFTAVVFHEVSPAEETQGPRQAGS